MKKFLKSSFWILFTSILVYNLFVSIIDYSISKNLFTHLIQKRVNTFEKSFNNSIGDSDLRRIKIEKLEWKNDSLLNWTTNKYPSINYSEISYNKSALLIATNGVFLYKAIRLNDKTYFYFLKLYNLYPYENEFLKNGFTWNEELFDGISIVEKESRYSIKNEQGNVLGYLNFNKVKPGEFQSIVLLVLFLIIYLSLFALLHQIISSVSLAVFYKRLLYYILSIAIYGFFCWTSSFSFIKETIAFQPDSFAYTFWFPSIMSILLLGIFVFNWFIFEYSFIKTDQRFLRYSFVNLVFIGFGFYLFKNLIPFIINNTTAYIGFTELTEINVVSILVFVTLGILILLFILFIKFFTKEHKKISKTDYFVVIASILIITLVLPFGIHNLVTILVIYFLVLLYTSNKIKSSITFNIFMVLLLSFYVNFEINQLNDNKEISRRKILVQSLALNQDPEVEYLFGEIEKKIYSDDSFISILGQDWYDGQSINEYLTVNYFSKNKHWKRYDFQVTSCDDSTTLIVKPSNIEISCNSYFYNNLISIGYTTANNNLYRMEYGSGQINYLGILRFRLISGTKKVITLYIEINSKIKRKGFTKLLSANGMDPFEKIRDYSLSRYENGFLSESYGDYPYPSSNHDSVSLGKTQLIIANGYSHLLYRPTQNLVYILSKPFRSFLQRIAPFSNLFILILILAAFFLLVFNSTYHLWTTPKTFSFRLQVYLIVLLTISLLLISYVSGYFIRKSNYEKDLKNHNRTAISLQVEFEQKLLNTRNNKKLTNEYLYELALKFSTVFNTDINLYDLKGQLITSTRPQIFDYNLLSRSMNPIAFELMKNENSTYINLNEKIGCLNYFSAYMPFHDAHGQIVAYINLPHITQQDQLSKEVSSFIMTLLNVYMLIMVMSVLVILLLSNYVIRPLRLIKDKMQKVKFGDQNEHIVWSRKDELGELVDEYNRMVDQIAKSAEVMARSERETAWQQMAQQVAHEIKNPLTPMKLSVQYLLRALDDGQPDWEERLRKLSSTLIDQIDTLASIASAFSDFAKMPVGKVEKTNLSLIINSAVELFKESENCAVNFINSNENIPVIADRNNLIRVFNNLITNAIQSIKFQDKGLVTIKVVDDDNRWKISIEDNGCGISDEEKHKIFLPNFTTKSSGMGLGLVMVKNIIMQHGGSVDFDSEIAKGTTFYVWLNKIKE